MQKHWDKLEEIKVSWLTEFFFFFLIQLRERLKWCQSDISPQPGAGWENAYVHTLEDLGEAVGRRDNGAALSTSSRVSGQHFSAQCRLAFPVSNLPVYFSRVLNAARSHSRWMLSSTPPWPSPAPAASPAAAPAASRSPCSAGRCAPCVFASPPCTSAAGFPVASLSSAGLLKVWWDRRCPLLFETQNARLRTKNKRSRKCLL